MTLVPTEPPPDEDSEDFTKEEADQAVETFSEESFAKMVAMELLPGHASVGKQDARYAMKSRELKRRDGVLYCRIHLGCPGEPDKVLVYRVNWLQEGKA